LPQSRSSSSRRLLLLGALVAAGALLVAAISRRDETPQRLSTGGDFSVCRSQEGDAARACYTREVGRELAVVGGTAAKVTWAGTGEVTFTSTAEGSEPLLCDLHARVGVVDEQVPSWLGWAAPLAAAS
jgi:hypothetical protein